MSEATYTYDPSRLVECGKDKMRFELGDTMVEGEAETSALTDEDINAVLAMYPMKWKRAKLALAESVCRRFSYEVDTKVGPLSLSLRARFEAWKGMYEELKKESGGFSVPKGNSVGNGSGGQPYFYAGMMENKESHTEWKGRRHDVP